MYVLMQFCQSNFITSQTELFPLDSIDKVKQYICFVINKFIGLVSVKTEEIMILFIDKDRMETILNVSLG